MEYNKDEAIIRAEGVAEKEVLEGTIVPSGPSSAETATKSAFNPSQHLSRNQTPCYEKTASTTVAFQYVPAPSPPTCNQRTAARNLLPISSPLPLRPETFWTSCNRCRIRSHFWPFHHQLRDLFAASSGFRGVQASSMRATTQVQPSGWSLKREREDAVSMSRGDEAREKKSTAQEKVDAALPCNAGSSGLKREKLIKKRHTDDQKWNCTSGGSQGTAHSRSGHHKASANLKGNLGAEQLLQTEIRGMLMGKMLMEILSQLNKWNTSESKSPHMKRFGTNNSRNDSKGDSINGLRGDDTRAGFPVGLKNIAAFSVGFKNKSKPQKSSTVKDAGNFDANVDETVSMTVPDADFHNFDKDRIEDSFSANQVWAVYDDDDGMPRYYALVHHVISRNPFQMQSSWLNSRTTSEFGSLDWVGTGFTKTSGDFRVGKSVFTKKLNSFSHLVKWKKGARGAIQIFLAKGDVWAFV